MSEQRITSLSNPRIKQTVRLRTHRERREQGRTLIDGARELLCALRSGLSLVEAYVCRGLCQTDESRQAVHQAEASGATMFDVTPQVFAKLAFGERAEGVVGVAETPHRRLHDIALPEVPLVAVLAGLEKPGNLGAILRTSDAAGLSAVIVADAGTDLYNPNVIRASLGTVFTQQVCAAAAREVLIWLRQRSFQVVAARVAASRDYTQIDYRRPTAIVLGSEACGLPEIWSGGDIECARLPMRGQGDSLNVSAAAAILFYEAVRQREAK